jgi:hypothetical protein
MEGSKSSEKLDKENTIKRVPIKKRAPIKRKLRPDSYTPTLVLLTKEKGMGRTENSGKEDNKCYPVKKKDRTI